MGEVRIPREGIDKRELLERMAASRGGDADWKGGRTWSLVYHAGEEHSDLLKKAYSMFLSENLLNPMAFKSLKAMEHEVVRMTAAMLHGGPKTVGTMTSGGTESLLLAVKTYRDRLRGLKPWLRRVEMVLPRSAHVAFEKAAHYFDVKIVHAPVRADFTADPGELERRIGKRTAFVAVSAPQYPQGVMDPVQDAAAVARRHKVPLHVDACIGGFLLPWIERLGRPVPPWDFRVPGVTSISADAHKYGYAAKGASVLLYRDMSFMRHQFFVSTDWPGGIYASATMPGTRPGGAVAAAWAAMNALGEDGYTALAKKTMEAADLYIKGIREVPELEVLGNPVMSLVAIGSRSPEVDIFVVADRLEDKGWSVDRQQGPACLHATVTGNHLKVIDAYLADLREAVAHAKSHPEDSHKGNAAMYGMAAKLPVRGMVRMAVLRMMEGMYGPDGKIPEPGSAGGGQDDPLMETAMRRGSAFLNFTERVLRKLGIRA